MYFQLFHDAVISSQLTSYLRFMPHTKAWVNPVPFSHGAIQFILEVTVVLPISHTVSLVMNTTFRWYPAKRALYTRHAYAWQIGPFWQNTLDFSSLQQMWSLWFRRCCVPHIDGWVHNQHISSMLEMEKWQFCTKPSIYRMTVFTNRHQIVRYVWSFLQMSDVG